MRYFLIAGEASGDLHGSNLMRELKENDSSAEFCFLGGDMMQSVGGKPVTHYRDMAFMGFLNVAIHAKTISRNFTNCKNAIVDFRPDVVILIDYPSFNLRIAKYVKKKIGIPVYYYISPKIWAWKTFRIKQIKKFIDKMFCIFPFEKEFYGKYSYDVEYVGNPTVETVKDFLCQNRDFEKFILENNLSDKPIFALLAGSRKQEIEKCLPKMIESANYFAKYQVVVAGAPGIEPDFYNRILKNNEVKIVYEKTYELLQNADVAIVNSGTATLETAIIGTPQVVIYHVNFGWLASLAKRFFIKTKHISLVNIIAQKEVVKELVAKDFTVKNIVSEMKEITENENYKAEIINNYVEIREKLGTSSAANITAKRIYELLDNH
jgi:lipid-A-disaccharide synthase